MEKPWSEGLQGPVLLLPTPAPKKEGTACLWALDPSILEQEEVLGSAIYARTLPSALAWPFVVWEERSEKEMPTSSAPFPSPALGP